MSDFDKEAEREKLREKYEQEQTEREATEKMSELLLQGATMTNAHCSDCGDPIFRYDGQEFCASCEKAVDRDTGDGDEGTQPDDGDEAENIEVTSPDEGARVAFGGENVEEAEAVQSPPQSDDPTHTEQSATHADTSPAATQPPGGQPPRQQPPTREVPSIEPGENADVTSARESLVRTLTRFSQQAEATEDPQRAQEYLAAAREAAEALSALRQ
jgi:uncharacterized Zn finger protein (UPF0148 family)